MDFGQKLIGNILSQDTINNMKDVVGMIKGIGFDNGKAMGVQERVLVQGLERYRLIGLI